MGDSREAMFPSILGYSIQSVSYNGGLLGLLMRNGSVRFPGVPGLDAQASGLSGILSLATGREHALLLRGDGTLVALGDNTYGQCSVPQGLDHVVAIAAGRYHSVALRDDGTVQAWGRLFPNWPENWPDIGVGEPASIPPGLRDVVAISAKGSQTLFLLGTPESPRVQVVNSPVGIEAVWPTRREVWQLQSSQSLFGTSWQTLSGPQESSGPWTHVRLAEGTGSSFFRLTQP